MVFAMMMLILDTGRGNHVLEVQQPGGIALAINFIASAFRVLHVDDELGRVTGTEDHAGIFRALDLQAHEVIQ